MLISTSPYWYIVDAQGLASITTCYGSRLDENWPIVGDHTGRLKNLLNLILAQHCELGGIVNLCQQYFFVLYSINGTIWMGHWINVCSVQVSNISMHMYCTLSIYASICIIECRNHVSNVYMYCKHPYVSFYAGNPRVFSPWHPPLVALCLHWLDDVDTFAIATALMPVGVSGKLTAAHCVSHSHRLTTVHYASQSHRLTTI